MVGRSGGALQVGLAGLNQICAKIIKIREDSSSISLSEIAGYQLYYGKAQGQYSNSITINDGTTTGYTLANLPSGTYHFVMTTLDTEGRESQFSPEIVLTV